MKLEWANPTGSMKDRMARSAIFAAVADGRLKPGSTVVEYTAGTTGISLAFVCAALGYRLHVVFSHAFSDEKRRTMEAFGAMVEDVASDEGRINETLIKAMIARAGEVARQPDHWVPGDAVAEGAEDICVGTGDHAHLAHHPPARRPSLPAPCRGAFAAGWRVAAARSG